MGSSWSRVVVSCCVVVLASGRWARADMCPYPDDAQDFTFSPAANTTFELEIGVPFADHVTVSGGPSSYYWQRLSGNVPPGMTDVLGLSSSMEAPTGSPTQAGTFTVRWCAYPWDSANNRIYTDCLCSAASYNFHVCGGAGTSCFGGQSDCCSGYTCQNTVCQPNADAAVPDAPDIDAPMPDAPPDAAPDADIDAAMPDAPDVDAAMPDADMPDADMPDGGVPDAMTDAAMCPAMVHGLQGDTCCVPADGTCLSDSDCCSPQSPSDPPLTCQSFVCKPAACAMVGGACDVATCCEGLSCATDVFSGHRRCCAEEKAACQTDDDCCMTGSASRALRCTNGTCWSTEICNIGKPCSGPDQCCPTDDSGRTVNCGVRENDTTATSPTCFACVGRHEACDSTPCCNGLHCDVESKKCCGQGGATCLSDDDCCSTKCKGGVCGDAPHNDSCSTAPGDGVGGGLGGALGGVLFGVAVVLLRRRRR